MVNKHCVRCGVVELDRKAKCAAQSGASCPSHPAHIKSEFGDIRLSPSAASGSKAPTPGEVLRQDAPGAAVKGDLGKPDFSLLSTKWLWQVCETLTYGAKNRGPNNWRKGLAITRLIAGALRHIFLFLDGENIDTDPTCAGCIARDSGGIACVKHSNMPHLACASCNLMFASELMVTRPDLDDRYKGEPKANG